MNGDAENERITRVRDLSCCCLRYMGGRGRRKLYSARLCGASAGIEQKETHDDPVVTLLPHVEAPLEQPHTAEPVRRLYILRHADFIPRVIFICGVLIGCTQVGQRSAGCGT